MPTLVLIDANSLLHRAYHALPPLTTPKGEPVGAVYGFTSMLLKVIEEIQPAYLAVAWDTSAPTFRHREFTAYKEHRPSTPEDLKEQQGRVVKILDAVNVPQVAVQGYEADDVVGTLAHAGYANKADRVEVIIVTGDLDLLQLVDAHIRVYTSRKSFSNTAIYDTKTVRERFGGLSANQIVDYKALRGDPSDNIPGVRGVGNKTAIKLLNKYQNLEAIYQNIHEIASRTQKLLISGREAAFLSQRLARIDTQVPIELDLQKTRVSDYDRGKVLELFREDGFRSVVARLP